MRGRMYDQCVRPEIEHIWNRIFEAERNIERNQIRLNGYEQWIYNIREDVRILFEHIEDLEQRIEQLEKEKKVLLKRFEECEKNV